MKKIILSKRRKVISVILGVTIISVGVGCFFIVKSKGKAAARIIPSSQTAQVSQGSISTTVVGTGTLESDTSLNIKIPSGITVQEVLVESGDKVSEGDVLATLDSASLAKAINEVQKEITSLDEKISECQDDTDTETLTANVAGRVKKIYASADTDVLDTISGYGTLLTLSLDGKMAVTLENAAALTQGESVSVTDSDGNTYTGTAAEISGSCATITITDNGPEMEDTVTVTSSSGTTLGSGTLYIHNQFDITASSGTVDAVYVSENQSVDKDTSLIKLTGVANSSEYEELLATRSNLTEKLQTLVNLSKTNNIVSEYSGTIQSVNISDGNDIGNSASNTNTSSDSSSSSASSSSQVSGMTAMSYSVVRLTSDGQVMTSESTEEPVVSDDDNTDGDLETQTVFTSITACSPTVDFPVIGSTPQKEIQETDEYSGTITWNTADEFFREGNSYSAVLNLTAKAGYCFTQNVSIFYHGAAVNYLTVGSEEDGNTISFQITFPPLEASDNSTMNTNDKTEETNSGNASGMSNSDTGSSGNTEDSTLGKTADSGDANSSSNSTVSASESITPSSENTASDTSSDTKTDSSSTSDINNQLTTAFTVSSDEYMILSVDIDELDILSIEEGQKATISFDALEDEEFEGTVSKISDGAATSSGGVSRYTVNIRIPADQNMRIGMNASATIVIEEKSDVLLIPVSALQERGDEVFVYTQEDTESGQLSGEVQVETGISDGSQVEITSGLTDGQTIYYTRDESSDNSSESMEQMMPGGMDSNMGSFPGGDSSGAPGGGSAPGGMGDGNRQGGQS